jgi:hypothetical protein
MPKASLSAKSFTPPRLAQKRARGICRTPYLPCTINIRAQQSHKYISTCGRLHPCLKRSLEGQHVHLGRQGAQLPAGLQLLLGLGQPDQFFLLRQLSLYNRGHRTSVSIGCEADL